MKAEVLNVRDFIVLHYHLTEREDSPFWRYWKNMPIPDSLRHRMELFKETGRVYINTYELFVEPSWLQVMYGQGITPKHYHPAANEMSEAELKKFLDDARTYVQRSVERMPSHHDYLQYYCKAEAWE